MRGKNGELVLWKYRRLDPSAARYVGFAKARARAQIALAEAHASDDVTYHNKQFSKRFVLGAADIYIRGARSFGRWLVELFIAGGGDVKYAFAAMLLDESFRVGLVGAYAGFRYSASTRSFSFHNGTPVLFDRAAVYKKLPPAFAANVDRVIGLTTGVAGLDGTYLAVGWSRTSSPNPPVYERDVPGVTYDRYSGFTIERAFHELLSTTLPPPGYVGGDEEVPYSVEFVLLTAGETRPFSFVIPDIRPVMNDGEIHTEELGTDVFSIGLYFFTTADITARVYYRRGALRLYVLGLGEVPYVGVRETPDPPIPPVILPPSYPPLPDPAPMVPGYSIGPTLVNTEIGVDGRTYYTYETYLYANYYPYYSYYIYNYRNAAGQLVRVGRVDVVGSLGDMVFRGVNGGPTTTEYVYGAGAVYTTTTTDIDVVPDSPPPPIENWWVDDDGVKYQEALPCTMVRSAGSTTVTVFATSEDDWDVVVQMGGVSRAAGTVPKTGVVYTEVVNGVARQHYQSFRMVLAAPLHKLGVLNGVDYGRIGAVHAGGFGSRDGWIASSAPVWWGYVDFLIVQLTLIEDPAADLTADLDSMILDLTEEAVPAEEAGEAGYEGALDARDTLTAYRDELLAQDPPKHPTPTTLLPVLEGLGAQYVLVSTERGPFDVTVAYGVGTADLLMGNAQAYPDPYWGFLNAEHLPVVPG